MKILDKKYTIAEAIEELKEMSEKSKGDWKMVYYWMAIGADLMAQRLTNKGRIPK